jgi:CDP-diacylglycerol--glycerol-3-phosphate 3-phosphatidyltransferase
MIVRDIIVDGYRIQASNKGIIVPANKWGKWKTNLQLFGVSAILLVFNNITLSFDETLNGAVYYLVQNGLLFVATILSVISGAFYVKDITKKLNAAKL